MASYLVAYQCTRSPLEGMDEISAKMACTGCLRPSRWLFVRFLRPARWLFLGQSAFLFFWVLASRPLAVETFLTPNWTLTVAGSIAGIGHPGMALNIRERAWVGDAHWHWIGISIAQFHCVWISCAHVTRACMSQNWTHTVAKSVTGVGNQGVMGVPNCIRLGNMAVLWT